MAKAIYIVGVAVLAVLVGAVFYTWLSGEQTITTAATSVPSTGTTEKATADDCPAAAGTVCYSQALADKIVKSCSKCSITSSKCRADYVAVSCST